MGILDTIKSFFGGAEKVSTDAHSMKTVKAAADASDYNQASIRAFYALEELGRVHTALNREVSTTAREYSQQLVETGILTSEDLEPIILNFEIAKYSEGDITFDDYRSIETALENAMLRFKKGGSARPAGKPGTKGKKKPTKKRRRRSTGAGVGPSSAARRRQARRKK